MQVTFDDHTGRPLVNGVPVFATISGGVVDCIVRCPNEATFDAVAKQVNMLSDVLDEDGVTVVGVAPNPGVNITRIGPVVLVPGVYNEDGVEITAPVIDTRFHVNYRLQGPALESGAWMATVTNWMKNGSQAITINKAEKAIELMSVELIDPLSITSPSRVWL